MDACLYGWMDACVFLVCFFNEFALPSSGHRWTFILRKFLELIFDFMWPNKHIVKFQVPNDDHWCFVLFHFHLSAQKLKQIIMKIFPLWCKVPPIPPTHFFQIVFPDCQ